MIARADRQMNLLEVRPEFNISSNAHARNAYGQVAQEIACAALGLLPIRIDGSCAVCFDAEKDETFYEIKSVHRHGKLVLYDWRMEKEAMAQVPVKYAAVVHSVRGARTNDDLWDGMARSLEILLLWFTSVQIEALKYPLRRIMFTGKEKRTGYNREGYRDGYRNVGLSKFREMATLESIKDFQLYGRDFSVVIREQP